ncbi:MAG: HDOD domain-containing protein, partial [Gammaproteobacteria bacterium]|nr:HDOD domain-containing protein [Gammaproteobacteria bacterium]
KDRSALGLIRYAEAKGSLKPGMTLVESSSGNTAIAQAMLGGLIHNIGALPILTKIDERWGYDADPHLISALIDELAPEIGGRILKHWNFADSLANIPTACYDLDYDPGPFPTYADIVLVARLQNLAAKGSAEAQAGWANIPAFGKIGVESEVVIINMEGPAEEIAEVRSMLEG